MTYAPATLQRLAAYWKAQGGTNLGIVGDAAHQARPTYHNGQDAIARYHRTALDDYSIRLARDREPFLTNAASAIDLGKLGGTYQGLRTFSAWLVARCRGDAKFRFDVREIIYSPDGKIVRRYSGPDNIVRDGGGDSSHLFHTHISFYRDSEAREKVPLFAPFFADPKPPDITPPDTGTEEPVGLAFDTVGPSIGLAKVTSDDANIITTDSGRFVPVPKGTERNVYALTKISEGKYDGQAAYLVQVPGTDESGLLLAGLCSYTPNPAPLPNPKTYSVMVGGKAAGKVTLP